MSTKKLYLFYFGYGVMNSITIQMMPLVMADKGFDAGQITMLLSVVFLAALFQPIVGWLTRAKFGSKRMLQILLVVMMAMALITFKLVNFYIMILVILVYSVARLSLSPINDSYATLAVRTHGINYGLVRSGASLGFGVGMAIYTIISTIFNLDYETSFVFIAMIAVGASYLIATLPKEQAPGQASSEEEGNTNLGVAVLLIVIYMIYFGGLNIRISYMSPYFIEFGYNTAFISLATFFMVIPEIIFLPLYNRLFAKYNKSLLIAIAIFLGACQMFLYVWFVNSPIMMLIASLFNGFQVMVFFPTFFGLLQDALGHKNSAFGFVMNMTIQSLFVGVFNLLVIRPIYIGFESAMPVYVVVMLLQLVAFVPLAIYYFQYSKKYYTN